MHEGRENLLVSDWKGKCHVLVYCFKPTSSQCYTYFIGFYYGYSSSNRLLGHFVKVFICVAHSNVCVCFVLRAHIRVWFSDRELMQAAGELAPMSFSCCRITCFCDFFKVIVYLFTNWRLMFHMYSYFQTFTYIL